MPKWGDKLSSFLCHPIVLEQLDLCVFSKGPENDFELVEKPNFSFQSEILKLPALCWVAFLWCPVFKLVALVFWGVRGACLTYAEM